MLSPPSRKKAGRKAPPLSPLYLIGRKEGKSIHQSRMEAGDQWWWVGGGVAEREAGCSMDVVGPAWHARTACLTFLPPAPPCHHHHHTWRELLWLDGVLLCLLRPACLLPCGGACLPPPPASSLSLLMTFYLPTTLFCLPAMPHTACLPALGMGGSSLLGSPSLSVSSELRWSRLLPAYSCHLCDQWCLPYEPHYLHLCACHAHHFLIGAGWNPAGLLFTLCGFALFCAPVTPATLFLGV